MNENLAHAIGYVMLGVTFLGLISILSSCDQENKRIEASTRIESTKLEQSKQQNLNDCLAKGNSIADCSFYLRRN